MAEHPLQPTHWRRKNTPVHPGAMVLGPVILYQAPLLKRQRHHHCLHRYPGRERNLFSQLLTDIHVEALGVPALPIPGHRV